MKQHNTSMPLKKNDDVRLTITAFSALGTGIGRHGGFTIFVDGGIRSGVDVFRAIALGADAVLIGRPFVNAIYGSAEEGVKVYLGKICAELKDTMRMCGAAFLKDIDRSMISVF